MSSWYCDYSYFERWDITNVTVCYTGESMDERISITAEGNCAGKLLTRLRNRVDGFGLLDAAEAVENAIARRGELIG